MNFCHNCGFQLPEGFRFCPSCGTPVFLPEDGAAPPDMPPREEAGAQTPDGSEGAPAPEEFTEPAASEYTGPADDGHTEPIASEPAQPADSGYTAPAGGGYTPPAGSGYTAPAGSGYTAPASGGYTPPTGSGYTPPTGSGYTPPANGGYTPPASGYTTPAGSQNQGAKVRQQPPKAPKAPADKRLIGVLIGCGALILVLVIVLIVVLVGRRNKTPDFDDVKNEIIQQQEQQEQQEPDSGASSFTGPGSVQQDTSSYEPYQNSNVKFSLEYPSACQVTEPYENCVMISDGSGFQMAVEYDFVTVAQDAFIYDAEDFNDMFQSNNAIVTDYLGTTNVTMRSQGSLTAAGEEGVYYDMETQLDGETYAVSLYVLDGHGDFGVYCVQVMMNEDSPNIEQYRAWEEHIMGTLSIDGSFEPEGYIPFDVDKLGVDFILSQDNYASDSDPDEDQYQFYPVEKVFVEARIAIIRSPYDGGDDVQKVMEGSTKSFTQKTNSQYASQLTQFHRGRYDCYTIDQTYEEDGKQMGVTTVMFLDEGQWWRISGVYALSYKDDVMSAMNELLMSLKVD